MRNESLDIRVDPHPVLPAINNQVYFHIRYRGFGTVGCAIRNAFPEIEEFPDVRYGCRGIDEFIPNRNEIWRIEGRQRRG